jgi:hypothetical protein
LNHRPTRLGTTIVAGIMAGALVLAQTPMAWAQGKPAAPPNKADLAAAKKHYGEGDKKFKAGDFTGAEAEFKLANDVKSTPQAERYIGMCEDSQGHFAAAVEWYDRFLSHVPERMAAQGEEIHKREATIKALPGKVHIASNPPGASVAVDGKPESAPTPMDIEVAPGPHTIKLVEPGRLPTEKTIDVAFASSTAVTADLDLEPPPAAPPPPPAAVAEAPPPPPPPPPAPPPEPRSKVPAYVTGALAIVGAGVGTAFGILALNDKSSFNKNPTTQTADNGDSHALICDMSFGVALTFGVTSAVLFLTRDDPPAPAASAASSKATTAKADGHAKKNAFTLTATPVVGPHSGGAGVTLRF